MSKTRFYVLTVLGGIIFSLILIKFLKYFVYWFLDGSKHTWVGKRFRPGLGFF